MYRQMKQIRLSNKNETAVNALVKDSQNDLLTVAKAANIAIEKGLPKTRQLFVKPNPKGTK